MEDLASHALIAFFNFGVLCQMLWWSCDAPKTDYFIQWIWWAASWYLRKEVDGHKQTEIPVLFRCWSFPLFVCPCADVIDSLRLYRPLNSKCSWYMACVHWESTASRKMIRAALKFRFGYFTCIWRFVCPLKWVQYWFRIGVGTLNIDYWVNVVD